MKKRVKNKSPFYFLGITIFAALIIIGFILVSFSNKKSESKNIFQKSLENIKNSYLRITGRVITGYVSCGDGCVVDGCQGIIKCTSTSSYCDIFPGCCNSPGCIPDDEGGPGSGGGSGGDGSGCVPNCKNLDGTNKYCGDSNGCGGKCRSRCKKSDEFCDSKYKCVKIKGCKESDASASNPYYVKGKVTGKGSSGKQITLEDECKDNKILSEKVCAIDGTAGSIPYTCPVGCENGACLQCFTNDNCKDPKKPVCDTRKELRYPGDFTSKPNPNYRKCSLECDAHVNIDGKGIICPKGKVCDLRKYEILSISNPNFGKCSLECVSNDLDFRKYGITCIDKSGFRVCDDVKNSKTYGKCKFECNGNDPDKDITCNNVLKPYCDIKDKTCKECVSDSNCPNKGYWCNKGKCVNDPVKCCIGYLEPFESPENDFHDKICSTLLDEDSCSSNILDCVWKEIGYPPAKGCVSRYNYDEIYANIHKDSNSKKCDVKAILPMYMDTQSQLANFFQKYNCKEQRYYFIYHAIKEDCKPYFDFFKQCMKCSAGKCNLYEGYHSGCSVGGDPKLVDQEANELRAEILKNRDYKTKVELSMNQMASTACAPTTLTIIITANSITKKYFSCSKIEEYNSMPTTGSFGKRSGCSYANKLKGIRYEKATCTAHDGKNYMVMCCPKDVQGNGWELEYVHPNNPVCKIKIG